MNTNEKNLSVLAPLDLSAAFHSADHNILLDRLEHWVSLSGTALIGVIIDSDLNSECHIRNMTKGYFHQYFQSRTNSLPGRERKVNTCFINLL